MRKIINIFRDVVHQEKCQKQKKIAVEAKLFEQKIRGLGG